jgi:hypothetical protein
MSQRLTPPACKKQHDFLPICGWEFKGPSFRGVTPPWGQFYGFSPVATHPHATQSRPRNAPLPPLGTILVMLAMLTYYKERREREGCM